jgi:transposase
VTLYGVEAGIRGKSAAERLAVRQEKTVPLLIALEGWLR